MTIEEALAPIWSLITAKGWVKSRPIPENLIATLCDALWDAGEHVQIKLIREHLPETLRLTRRPPDSASGEPSRRSML